MAHHLAERPAGLRLVPIADRRLVRRRWEQAASRELAEVAISDFATIQHRKLQAAGCVGRAALRQVALTHDFQNLMNQSSPLSIPHLDGICAIVVAGIAEITHSTVERLAAL